MSLQNAVKPIVVGGLIAGTLDITAACVSAWLQAGVTPVRVAQSVASGAIGRDAAVNGGIKTALLGLAFHYLIATTATAVFYFASRKLRFLVNWPVSMGLLYGVFVYLFMNFVVLPLSNVTRRGAPPLSSRAIQMLIIMFCVGLPIALIVRWFSKDDDDGVILPNTVEADPV
jgi:hypothetical protein